MDKETGWGAGNWNTDRCAREEKREVLRGTDKLREEHIWEREELSS